MMRKSLVRILIIAPCLMLAAGGLLYVRSPAGALDTLNSLVPGDGGVIQRIDGASYGTGPLRTLEVWTPREAAASPRPVIVFFYGGAWVKGRREDYGFVAKAYAARGFVVVLADYRKVPAVRFPDFVEDGAAAIRWVHDHIGELGGDRDRIVTAGHSAGGYIAVLLALDRRYLAAAGLPRDSVKAALGLAGPYDFYPFDSARAVAAMGNAPDPFATQPISFARRDAPPLWLATGTADTEVRPRNAIALARREHALGNRSTELRQYPGLSHNDLIMAVSKPFRGKAPVLADSIAFLARHGLAPD